MSEATRARIDLEDHLRSVRSSGRKILAPYLTAGLPSPDGFADLVAGVADAGADVIEIGVPFSDPIMDGPVIQEASARALEMEMRPQAAIRAMGAMRLPVPFIFMTYVNPVVQTGWDDFARDAAAAGASGVLIPDLPAEEADPWVQAARAHDVATAFMVAPTTPDDRLQTAVSLAQGFVYCVSLLGVTGMRSSLSERAEPLVERVRRLTDTPALLGIGVSTPQQAVEACRFADGAIVGSAIIKAILDDGPAAAVRLVRQMREALDGTVD